MSMEKGLEGGRYKPLSDEDISTIHETSMRVFSEIGIRVNHKKARDLFASAGADVNDDTCLVKIKPQMVTDLAEKAPDIIRLYGRKPEHSLEVGGKKVYAGTGGTALYVMEPGSKERRPAILSDLKDIARIVDELENIHFFMLPIFPSDLSEKDVDVNRFGVALTYCSKHIMGGVYTVEGVRNVIKMAELIAGSKEALREKPIISMVTCCGISPFVLDDKYSELTIEVAEAGIPVVTPVEPLCGATSPVTLAGNLVVQNVDTLAGVMLTQLVNPGTPVFYGCISSLVDMKDMKYLSGAVEMGLMNAAATQMARHYRLPIYATAGMSDSKTIDAQAGYESAITSLLVALAGGNWIHDAAGFIEFCMCASLEKYVVDNEILGMVMRAVKGIEVNKNTLAFDLMREIGAGGHFVSSRHTRKFMRMEQYKPELSDRGSREEWESAGSPDARDRAYQKVMSILNRPETPALSDAVREKIRAEIPGVDKNLI
ncbi:MAG: trimethylamine methyltransferase family protein [Nitrospirota bacterium]|nr:trimethylamine methyltransferase family protein [Nitrospirota bacterium]